MSDGDSYLPQIIDEWFLNIMDRMKLDINNFGYRFSGLQVVFARKFESQVRDRG